jgi:hypothetical protein
VKAQQSLSVLAGFGRLQAVAIKSHRVLVQHSHILSSSSRAECAPLEVSKLLNKGVEWSAKRGLQVILDCGGGDLEDFYEEE